MLRILLIRPGATELDEQGRIKGSLDIPLSDHGIDQVRQTVDELAGEQIKMIYASACLSARQTAEQIAENNSAKVKIVSNLHNLNRGLWQGKSIDELRTHQPKVFRQMQESPEFFSPPGGESIHDAQIRVGKWLAKVIRKHHDNEVIAIVAPEPLASVIRSRLSHGMVWDVWQQECRCGNWDVIDIELGHLVS